MATTQIELTTASVDSVDGLEVIGGNTLRFDTGDCNAVEKWFSEGRPHPALEQCR